VTSGARLVAGGWDLHVHAAPSLFERRGDVWDLAGACAAAGMAGVVLKSHHGSSVEAAALVGARVPSLAVYGGVVLNGFVGGLNALAVETCLALGGRIVWLPTVHAAAHEACFGTLGGFPFQASKVARRPARGLSILDTDGRLARGMLEVLEVLEGRPAVLATGHVSAREILALAGHLRETRADVRLLLTHVFFKVPRLTVDELRVLQSDRTWFETAWFTVSPKGNATAAQVATWIGALPSARWIMSSDSGQAGSPPGPEALETFARGLIESGLEERRVRAMLIDEPARLLGV
jgi:hypothetical protein